MTTPATPRVVGKRGRLRSERTPLKFVHQYAVTQLPAPVYPVDVRGGIADADDLFEQQQPWTTANGEQPDTSEGHCVVKVYAGDPASQGAEDGYVTWGAFQKATKDWSKACLTEAFVILTSEDETAKVDMTALRADIEAWGGVPAVAPVPEPDHKSLLGELAALVREAEASTDHRRGTGAARCHHRLRRGAFRRSGWCPARYHGGGSDVRRWRPDRAGLSASRPFRYDGHGRGVPRADSPGDYRWR